MKKWTPKQQMAFWYIISILGVYVSFRFLLPFTVIFLMAYLIACALEPFVSWMHKKLHLPKSFATILLLFICGGILFLGSFLLLRQIGLQGIRFGKQIPGLWQGFLNDTRVFFLRLEELFHLKEGSLAGYTTDLMAGALEDVKSQVMPYLASFGVRALVVMTRLLTGFFIMLFAVILCVNDLNRLRHFRDYSMFSREVALLRKPILLVGKAYIRTQLLLFLFTMTLLIVGFSILRNPYAVLLGISIGLLDALPLFGTGTVLIPWAILSIFGGNILYAVVLILLYLICYFVREYAETIWMGDILGMTSLETLISMYIGLKLFSIWGLFLGPVGWLIVREIVKNQEKQAKSF